MSTTVQVSRIANFIEQVNYNSDQKALDIVNSPPKRRRTPGPEMDVSVKEGRDLGGKSGRLGTTSALF